ncbi:ceramide-1-phosphate transfer protein-like [Diadema antillarum]|uniref:ceramide-1-phosphate transfer protein-like n=1 Tax=Diadema antillarum TaxID=105358 RepID=UPI003A844A36
MAEKLDIQAVQDHFKAAKKDDGTVVIEDLMKGYGEIARLYDIMGSMFAFVAKDMRYRLKVLTTHRSDVNGDKYQTVQSALTFETENGIKKKTKSGTMAGNRAMLEMHFDIEFFIVMFQKLAEGEDDSKCSELAREAFDKTLGEHVNFAVRQAARLAIRWLPTRKVFVDSYIKQDTAEALKMIGPTTEALQAVYDIMDAEFAKRDIK